VVEEWEKRDDEDEELDPDGLEVVRRAPEPRRDRVGPLCITVNCGEGKKDEKHEKHEKDEEDAPHGPSGIVSKVSGMKVFGVPVWQKTTVETRTSMSEA
jgi:hypothetical protein